MVRPWVGWVVAAAALAALAGARFADKKERRGRVPREAVVVPGGATAGASEPAPTESPPDPR